MLCHHAVHGEIRMKLSLICALLVGVSVGLSGCNKAKSPDEVQADVAKATREADANSAKADAAIRQTEAQAAADLAKDKADAEARAADRSIAAVADSALADAEGANKVELAKCEALQGDAQQQCRDAANARLKTIKDRVAAAKGEQNTKER